MKERPILFSAPMVRAILDGSKMQTRRVVKPQPKNDRVGMVNAAYCGFPQTWLVDGAVSEYTCEDEKSPVWVCSYGKPGDRLWVRETWAPNNVQPLEHRPPVDYLYAATDSARYAVARWKPSIHMPRAASRITLEITGVRVERLQGISEEDARAEGITDSGCLNCGNSETDCGCLNPRPDARDSFIHLWQSINGEGSWGANPWVWVVEFKRVESSAAVESSA